MIDKEQKIWTAISSVINGNPTNEEQELVDSWINENDGNRKFYNIVSQSSGKIVTFSDEVKERIFSKVEASVLPSKKSRRINFWIPAAVASVAILILITIYSLFINYKAKNEIIYLESSTPVGAKTKIVLSDNTIVYMNAGTSLKYPAKFTKKTRDVYLKGEAYFEVEKDADHPFIVRTSSIAIKVLGTHFNVKSYPEEDITETTLLEGSVALYTNTLQDKETVRLKPNEKALFSEKTGKIKLKKVNAELEASWKDDRFYFDNELLPSILRTLERNYNVPIRIYSQELNDEAFSGFFHKSRTIYQTLDIMKLHKNFYYKINNDTILIYKKKL